MDLVSTIIKNTAHAGRTLTWTSKGAVWLDAGQSTVVDYDVWSNANRRQQECIIAECQRGSIELTLVVIDAFGKTFNITLDPSIILRPIPKVEVPAEEPVEFPADPVEAPADAPVEEPAEAQEGAQVEAQEGAQVDAEEEEVAVVVEEPVAEEPVKEEVLTRAEAEQQYTICVEAKDWEGAIKVLKAFARTEELPLSDKTLMAIKDKSFNNVVKRYDIGD